MWRPPVLLLSASLWCLWFSSLSWVCVRIWREVSGCGVVLRHSCVMVSQVYVRSLLRCDGHIRFTQCTTLRILASVVDRAGTKLDWCRPGPAFHYGFLTPTLAKQVSRSHRPAWKPFCRKSCGCLKIATSAPLGGIGFGSWFWLRNGAPAGLRGGTKPYRNPP